MGAFEPMQALSADVEGLDLSARRVRHSEIGRRKSADCGGFYGVSYLTPRSAAHNVIEISRTSTTVVKPCNRAQIYLIDAVT